MDELNKTIQKRATFLQEYLATKGFHFDVPQISEQLSKIIIDNLDQSTNSFLKTFYTQDPYESHS